MESLADTIKEVRAYTRAHPELLRAHHFLYDLPLRPTRLSARFVVIGVNPGEQKGDWEVWPEPTEETSLFDFRAELGSRPPASLRWRDLTKKFCQTDEVVMTEFFPWSSANLGQDFLGKFGTRFKNSPHLGFCVEITDRLVNHYRPEAVVCSGLGAAKVLSSPLGLTHVGSLKVDGHRLVETFERDGVSWHFTKHWSGSFGFSTAQRDAIITYMHARGDS